MPSLRLILTLLFAIAPAVAGDVTGQVLITKRLTKKSVIPGVYNLREASPPPAATEPDATDMDRIVVWLSGAKGPAGAALNTVMEQHNMRFEPDLLVIPMGSTVQFLNGDPILHNVFSLSRIQPFDLGYYPQNESRGVKFTRPGIVQVYCHLHANMYAAIVVADSPWYARPSVDGSFAWTHVPSGHYRATAWHKDAGLFYQDVDVPGSGAAKVKIAVPVNAEP